jgi:hypothetical protein
MALKTVVVGHTTSSTSRILAIFERPPGPRARLVFDDGGGQRSVDADIVPAQPVARAVFKLDGLRGTPVRYEIMESAANGKFAPVRPIVGEASFRPLPAGPLKVALVSCNDIGADELPKAQRGAMWRALYAQVKAGEVDLIVHAGDQIYGDKPPVGWIREQGWVAAYRQHYADTWSHPDVAPVLARCPSVMMWDDHEIYDGRGSHDNDDSEAALNRYRAAETAFKEFQLAVAPPDKLEGGLGWLFRHAGTGIIALDGRSQRSWKKSQVLGRKQLEALEVALGELIGLKLRHLYVVVGTPVVNAPLLAAERLATLFNARSLDDLRDGWMSSRNVAETRRLLMRLLDFSARSPETQVTILGGDIHIGTLARIDTRLPFGPQQRRPRLYQITSSGIARPAPTGLASALLSIVERGGSQKLYNDDIVGSLLAVAGAERSYYVGQRNFAVLDGGDGAGEWNPHGNLKVCFHVEDGERIRVLEQLLVRKKA